VEHGGKSERRKTQRAKGGGRLILSSGNANLGLGLEKNILFILVFFLSAGLVGLVRFGSVQSVSDFGD
jgi:hypothetical protein